MRKIIFIVCILISCNVFASDLNLTSVITSAVFTQPVYSNPQPALPGIRYQRTLSDSGQHISRRAKTDVDKDSTPYLFYDLTRDTLFQRVNNVTKAVSSGGISTVAIVGNNGLSVTGSPGASFTLGLNAITPTSVSASGAITGAWLSGILTTNAQPNVTSLGSLISLTVTNGVSVGGNLTVTGTIVQSVITSALIKANISGQIIAAVSGSDYIAPGGTGLTTGISSTVIAAGTLIARLIFYDPASIYVSVGTSVNARDVCPRFTISAGGYSVIVLNRYFVSGTTIYFNGITSNTVIKIYKE